MRNALHRYDSHAETQVVAGGIDALQLVTPLIVIVTPVVMILMVVLAEIDGSAYPR